MFVCFSFSFFFFFFFFNDTATTEIYTLSYTTLFRSNPAYTAPVDLAFAAAISKVQLRAHLSLYSDETSALCQWQIPEAHFLEAWSDARGYDGTASIVQPLIAPLYGGKSAHEVLAAMSERPERSGHDLVREHWQDIARGSQARERGPAPRQAQG